MAHEKLVASFPVLSITSSNIVTQRTLTSRAHLQVVLTDYLDSTLIDNLTYNVESNIELHSGSHAIVKGYIRGQSVTQCLDSISPSNDSGFDLIIMSDLVFNHSQHDAPLNTCDLALASPSSETSPSPALLVFYTHHRPHLAERDLDFFRKARELGWICEEIVTENFPAIFPEDPGEEEVRATVHGWRLRKPRPSGS
ncbi:hypothetical protein EWM64_g4772 [Hericium alpestre]|uniref:Uncharacterized protein n=1 Tax=Hericium alpestre TaxID=135208 RepID=A0A4Z0A0C4_9AGAM|nr:hypothetical protein EWM64_g4772 [Hericium alpestre]